MITAKITKKGQITIPASFRKKLKTDTVKIEIKDNKIIITPFKNFGGIFQEYAIKNKSIEENMNFEQEAIENARKEKFNNNRH
jgi:AbrB family looped-hinge helix DNA binding protein